jgi:hypothetical protein
VKRTDRKPLHNILVFVTESSFFKKDREKYHVEKKLATRKTRIAIDNQDNQEEREQKKDRKGDFTYRQRGKEIRKSKTMEEATTKRVQASTFPRVSFVSSFVDFKYFK